MKILVTGGSKGVGAAIVKYLATDPANTVYFTYAKSGDAAKEVMLGHPNTVAFRCDFTDPASVTDLTAEIRGMDLDILVNNAYPIFNKEYFHKTSIETISGSFNINILPVLRITQTAISVFRRKKLGRIITILSSVVTGRHPLGWSDYAANKNYLLSLSKSWAIENARFRITSNSISPSFMSTDFTADTDERILEGLIESNPLKKLLTPSEVAEAVSFLCHCSPQINGINLPINAAQD